MRMRGFLLTTDSLLALALLLLAAGTLTVASQQASTARNYLGLEALGRDYLVLKYAQNATLNESAFNSFTGFQVNETRPGAEAVSMASRAYIYPFPLAACGCASEACNLTGSVNDSCLNAQENLSSALKRAWVKP